MISPANGRLSDSIRPAFSGVAFGPPVLPGFTKSTACAERPSRGSGLPVLGDGFRFPVASSAAAPLSGVISAPPPPMLGDFARSGDVELRRSPPSTFTGLRPLSLSAASKRLSSAFRMKSCLTIRSTLNPSLVGLTDSRSRSNAPIIVSTAVVVYEPRELGSPHTCSGHKPHRPLPCRESSVMLTPASNASHIALTASVEHSPRLIAADALSLLATRSRLHKLLKETSSVFIEVLQPPFGPPVVRPRANALPPSTPSEL